VVELGEKTDAGTLTDDERDEYRALADAGTLVALLKAKARRVFARHSSGSMDAPTVVLSDSQPVARIAGNYGIYRTHVSQTKKKKMTAECTCPSEIWLSTPPFKQPFLDGLTPLAIYGPAAPNPGGAGHVVK
jgi:hypothetical protein